MIYPIYKPIQNSPVFLSNFVSLISPLWPFISLSALTSEENSRRQGMQTTMCAHSSPPPRSSDKQCRRPPPHHLDPSELAEQVSLIEKLGVFKIHGRDKRGRRILRIVGKFLPIRLVTVEAVKKFLENRIYPKLSTTGGPFSILYIHTESTRPDNFPGFSSLRSIYDAAFPAVKDNLEAVYFLHPPGSLHYSRLFLATFGRLLLFPAGLYEKVKYVSRVEFLWEHVRRGEVDVPDFVYEYDEGLENRPIVTVDYGIESDHRRGVYDAAAAGAVDDGGDDDVAVWMDSSSSSDLPIYSLRCIS